MALAAPKSLVVAGTCHAHKISLTVNNGTETKLMDREYSLAATLTQGTNVYKMVQGCKHMTKHMTVFPGVPPPEEYTRQHDVIMKYTMLRPLVSKSYLRSPEDADVDSNNPSPEEQKLLNTAKRIKQFYQGNWWNGESLEHYCYAVKTGGSVGMCCATRHQCQKKAEDRLDDVLEHAVYGVEKPAKNRWWTCSECNRKECLQTLSLCRR